MTNDNYERRSQRDPEPNNRRNRSRSGASTLLITLGILALLVFVALLVLPGLRAKMFGQLSALATAPTPTIESTPTLEPTPTTVPTPTLVAVTAPGVLRRIESIRSLQTTIFRVDTIVRTKERDGKTWLIFTKQGQKLILFVSGKVIAGVDLNELQVGNVKVDNNIRTVNIMLPPAKILEAKLDDYTVETYDGSVPEKVSVEALQNGLQLGQQQIAKTACENGVLEQATKDAAQTFEACE